MQTNENNAQVQQLIVTNDNFCDQPLYAQFLNQYDTFYSEVRNGLEKMFLCYIAHQDDHITFEEENVNLAYKHFANILQNVNNIKPVVS